LYHAEDLPFAIKDIQMFLPILEKNRARCYSKSCFDGPLAITSPDIPEMILPTLQELGLEFSEIDCRDSIKGGETAAMQRLNHYFFETKNLSVYKETRNGMVRSVLQNFRLG
jgi:deoxyribodipyrimidine photo-lyase